MKTEGNKSAYPTEYHNLDNPGLTKRELFAAMAMQALIAAMAMKALISYQGFDLPEKIAASSLDYADVLLSKLNKSEK